MLKKYIIILLIFITFNAYPETGISFGVLGAGFSNANGTNSGNYFGRFLYLYHETDTGFCIAASPLILSMKINDLADYSLTFVNAFLYFNFLKSYEGIVLGPVVSFHTVAYDNLGFFETHFGLQFSFKDMEESSDDSIFFKGHEFIVVELGYKYNKQQKGFYAYAGVNLLGLLSIIGHIGESIYSN